MIVQVSDFRATGLMGAKVTKRILAKNKRLVEYFLADIVVLESYMGDGIFYPLMANCLGVLVGVCKLIGLAETSTSANILKMRPIEEAVKEITTISPANNPGSRTSSSDFEQFFQGLGSSLRGLTSSKQKDIEARRQMQLSSLFQDARTFDMLLTHVMIQFHNDFMHDAIHKGATYMDSSAILASTLAGTAAWLREPMPIFERLRSMQESQTHYNSDEYVSVFIADIMIQQQMKREEQDALHEEQAQNDFTSSSANPTSPASSTVHEEPTNDHAPPPPPVSLSLAEDNETKNEDSSIDPKKTTTIDGPIVTTASNGSTGTQAPNAAPSFALASRFQTLSSGLSRKISSMVSGAASLSGKH